MSNDRVAKKIQRKAERRAERKLPVSEGPGGIDLPPASSTEGATANTLELDDQGNPVGTTYNEDGSIAQPIEHTEAE